MASASSVQVVMVIEPLIQYSKSLFPEGMRDFCLLTYFQIEENVHFPWVCLYKAIFHAWLCPWLFPCFKFTNVFMQKYNVLKKHPSLTCFLDPEFEMPAPPPSPVATASEGLVSEEALSSPAPSSPNPAIPRTDRYTTKSGNGRLKT